MDISKLAEQAFKRDLSDYQALTDAFEVIRELEKTDFDSAHQYNKMINRLAAEYSTIQHSSGMFDVYNRSMLFEAPHNFDFFMRYMEKNRPAEKRFYLPRRKQLKPLADAMQDLAERKLELLAISLPPGVGKALANDTPILTRYGWKNHGDLVVGDEVIGLDGQFKKVIAVHPKCQLDCLVEFTNGEKIVCHENHEWLIHDRARHKNQNYIAETKYIEKRKLNSGGEPGHRGHRYVIQLPKRSYIVGYEKALSLDPYTLGVWLGDGANRNPRICCAAEDKAVIDRIVNNGYPVRWNTVHKQTGVLYFDFDIRKELKSLGMCYSKKTTPKYIPEKYLTASIDQRLQLLAGLLDTDGCLAGSKYQFTTTDEALKDSFIELVSTFGWRTSLKIALPTISSSGIHGRKKCFTISFTPDLEIPCELERKKNKAPHKQRAIGFKSIRRIVPKEGNCITVEGDGMYLAGKTMIPTHNTTLALFFLCWLSGRNPEKPILTGSHANSFLSGAYSECLRMISPDGDYLWNDVFPELKIIQTNAKDMLIDVGKDKKDAKRFTTLEFTSVGAGNAGKVRAENLLYCDDLVDGLEAALSRDRMDKLWSLYTTDLRQRKIGDCVELHIATRWSVHDVIGRLEQMYGNSEKARFIVVPALNENEESNFAYPIEAGFTTEFYHKQREIMDDASWRALFMNEPIEREGQLYPEQELRRYFELPDSEPDAVVSVCDTKDRGTDYCCMPVAYQYGQDFYIDDVVCDNSAPEVVETRLVMTLLKNSVHMSRFESNSAGGKIAEKVQSEVKTKGGRTRITTKYTTQNKETKILVASPWVKEHCLFKDNSVIKDDKEYRLFLRFLTGYTMTGKNKNDDVPDAMSQLADYAQSFTLSKVEVFTSPFR